MKPYDAPPLFYPILGAELDLGYVRLSGHGLGNGFYSYFHALALAIENGGAVVSPPWHSIKPARILRGKFGERSYWDLFKTHPNDVSGTRKFRALLLKRHDINAASSERRASHGHLNVVACWPFTFRGLHKHRELIRKRFSEITREAPPAGHSWGSGRYAAVHVRMGDFGKPATIEELESGNTNNLRIPLSWYKHAIVEISNRRPDLPIYIISDGSAAELSELLSDRVCIQKTGSDIGDLYALSGASVLIGSNSTYSRWAAFLGDMPTVWLRTKTPPERPTSDETPLIYLGLNGDPDTDIANLFNEH